MAMIETVRQRQRNATDFGFFYENLCALQNSCPLGTVTANLDEQTIDCNADRIRLNDWTPIWNALRVNKSIRCVAFRSFWQQTLFPDNEFSEQRFNASKKKAPPIRSKDTTNMLCRTLKECLCTTECLSYLTLQGIPLRERDLAYLAKGITKNQSLQNLSLEYCQIADRGLELLSNAIKGSRCITHVNFTGCSLSWRGAETISKIIKFQATRRHGVAWQDSLRYRRPDLDRMSGLRRITICKNPMIGDKGVEFIAEALKDDLWVKALDLQQCGVSTVGALAFQSVLKFNTTLTVLDLRLNPLIDRGVMSFLMEQIMINSNDQEVDFPWLLVEEPKPGRIRPLKKGNRQRTVSTAYGRKTTRNASLGCRTRSATLGQSPIARGTTRKPGAGFVPWRTAARVGKNRHRLDQKTEETQTYKVISKKKRKTPEFEKPKAKSSPINTDEDENEDEDVTPRHRHYISDETTTVREDPKELKIEVEFLSRRLNEESSARASADTRVLELQVENRRLQQELRLFKVKQRSSEHKNAVASSQTIHETRKSNCTGNGKSLLEDDRFLESIEASFKQFYMFLDLLKGKGYGDLVHALQENGFPVSPKTQNEES